MTQAMVFEAIMGIANVMFDMGIHVQVRTLIISILSTVLMGFSPVWCDSCGEMYHPSEITWCDTDGDGTHEGYCEWCAEHHGIQGEEVDLSQWY